MFCPPGYIDWKTMRSITRNLAERVYLADALETLDEDPQMALDESVNAAGEILSLKDHKWARKRLSLSNSNFEIELISFWIMNQLDENYGAVLCSRLGKLLKANHPILFHPDEFYFFSLDFPLRKMPELFRIFEEYDAKRMSGRDFWNRYCCIDGDTGAIRQKNQTKRLYADNFDQPPGFGPREGIFGQYVKPFIGCYVVFDSGVYPDSYYDNLEVLNLLNKHWVKPELDIVQLPIARKRGSKPAPAKGEFFARYPNGLPEGLSAEAVAAELTEAGYPITGRSIQNYDLERRVRK